MFSSYSHSLTCRTINGVISYLNLRVKAQQEQSVCNTTNEMSVSEITTEPVSFYSN